MMWAATAMAASNLAFVLADDWGWGDAGAYAKLVNGGDKPPVTPHLDRMASEGTMFTRFHTPLGLQSKPHVVADRLVAAATPRVHLAVRPRRERGDRPVRLPQPLGALPAAAAAQGSYRAAHYGKWHLGCTPGGVNSYGFDDSATYV